MKKKVLAPGLVPETDRWAEKPDATTLHSLQKELEEIAVVDAYIPVDFQEWSQRVRSVHVIAGPGKVDEELLKNADKLEMIQKFGIGYDNIDVGTCTEKDIIVCNVPEIYSESVAQHTWGLILDLTKHISRADRSMREGTWLTQDWTGCELWGKTLGVVGLGNIGSRVAMKGRLAFGMKILAHDPYVRQERATLFGAELVSLERLLKDSDVVTVTVPLTPDTYHMIGENQLKIMKKSAFIINTCRGKVIEEKALINSLQNKEIGGAGLDVFETEPLPQDSKLLKMENVVLTPHIASSTEEAIKKTYQEGVKNILKHLKGLKPNWIVNAYTYKK